MSEKDRERNNIEWDERAIVEVKISLRSADSLSAQAKRDIADLIEWLQVQVYANAASPPNP